MDISGEALWLKNEAGIFAIATDSLQPHVCFLWHEFIAALPLLEDVVISSEGVVLNPESRELYICLDYSMQIDADDFSDDPLTCEVLCLTPQADCLGDVAAQKATRYSRGLNNYP